LSLAFEGSDQHGPLRVASFSMVTIKKRSKKGVKNFAL
jgi:hypothetical protein